MQSEDEIRATFEKQAEWCEVLGSPLTARLVAGLGERLDHSTATGRRVLRWDGQADALKDAVALRAGRGAECVCGAGQGAGTGGLLSAEPFARGGCADQCGAGGDQGGG